MTLRSTLFRARSGPAYLTTVSLLGLGLLTACAESDEGNETEFLPVNLVDSSVLDAGGDAFVWPSDDAATQRPGDGAGLDSSLVVDSGSDASSAAGDAGADEGGTTSGPTVGIDGTGYTALPTTGTPLDAKNNVWTYFEFADTSCRDGSKAGINVFRNTASKKVMFFFEGGGACFNSATCSFNPKAVDATDKAGPTGGILDRENAANPLKDWNIVYVPYCTGDVFSGTNANGNIEGVGPQKFVGYTNTLTFLQRVVPTFKDATDLLVTGVSAGGFGASASVVPIQRAFPWVKAKLLDDSGPPMPSSVLATCLQKKWRENWGLEQSMLKDCGASCTKPDDYTFDYGVHLAKVFNNRLSGMIEAQGDEVISMFFGQGLKGFGGAGPCTGIFLVDAVPAETFKSGLLQFREAVKPYSSFGSFYPAGTQHTWLMGPSFYTHATGGTKLVDWVSDIVNDKGTKHVGP